MNNNNDVIILDGKQCMADDIHNKEVGFKTRWLVYMMIVLVAATALLGTKDWFIDVWDKMISDITMSQTSVDLVDKIVSEFYNSDVITVRFNDAITAKISINYKVNINAKKLSKKHEDYLFVAPIIENIIATAVKNAAAEVSAEEAIDRSNKFFNSLYNHINKLCSAKAWIRSFEIDITNIILSDSIIQSIREKEVPNE